MENRINELFATVLGVPVDQIGDTTTPDDIEGWDSFRQLMLISAFEEELDISIEPEEIVGMYKNYKAFKDVVLNKLHLQ